MHLNKTALAPGRHVLSGSSLLAYPLDRCTRRFRPVPAGLRRASVALRDGLAEQLMAHNPGAADLRGLSQPVVPGPGVRPGTSCRLLRTDRGHLQPQPDRRRLQQLRPGRRHRIPLRQRPRDEPDQSSPRPGRRLRPGDGSNHLPADYAHRAAGRVVVVLLRLRRPHPGRRRLRPVDHSQRAGPSPSAFGP